MFVKFPNSPRPLTPEGLHNCITTTKKVLAPAGRKIGNPNTPPRNQSPVGAKYW
jgi:hypothetical protein